MNSKTLIVGAIRWALLSAAFYAGTYGVPGMVLGALIVTLMTPPVRA